MDAKVCDYPECEEWQAGQPDGWLLGVSFGIGEWIDGPFDFCGTPHMEGMRDQLRDGMLYPVEDAS